jgi:hypothetical protein
VTRLAQLWLLAVFFVVTTLFVAPARSEDEPKPPRLSTPEEVLAQEKYRFCHEARYPLFEEERAWCPLAGDPSERCPQLPAACEAKVDPKQRIDWAWGGDGSGKPKPGEPGDGDGREEAPRKWTFEWPEGLSIIGKLLFFALIVVGSAALIWVVVRNLRDDRLPETELPPEAVAVVEDQALDRVVETDVDRLLARARACAGRGEFDEAVELAYAALLRRLEGTGHIDMHESLTNGDYVRALRQHPDLAQQVRQVVRDVERVQFGAAPASAGLFESVLQRVLPLVGRAAALLLLLLSSTTLMGCPGDGGDGSGSMSRGGTSPSGSRGVVELLAGRGIQAGYRTDPLRAVDDTTGVLIMLPGGREEPEDWEAVFAWVEDGGMLIVAGASPPAEVLDVSWHHDAGNEPKLIPTGEYSYLLGDFDVRVPIAGAVKLEDPRFSTDATITRDPWSSNDAHYGLSIPHGEGEVLVLADAQLFTNISLTVGDNPELLVRLLQYRGKVEISDPLTGAGSQTPLEALHRARLTPLMVQLLVLLILFVLWKGTAFGKPREPAEHRRRSFADHVSALGTQYARANASQHALGAYSAWALERLRERVPRGRRRGMDELAAELAARSGRSALDVAGLLHEAQAASDMVAPASYRPESLRGKDVMYQPGLDDAGHRVVLMRQLAQLLEDVGSERQKK